MSLELVPITRDIERLFIREHHRHNGPLPQAIIRVGLVRAGSPSLVGVAVAGIPARMLMDGWSLEVARVCTTGEKNACSMLYGAVGRAAKALGWRRLYTYTLDEEDAASVKASGFVLDAAVPAREYLVKNGSRPRYDTNLLGEQTVPEGAKNRWRRDLVLKVVIK